MLQLYNTRIDGIIFDDQYGILQINAIIKDIEQNYHVELKYIV